MSGRRKTTPIRLLDATETFNPVSSVDSMPSTSAASDIQSADVQDSLMLAEANSSIKLSSKQLVFNNIFKQESIRKNGNMMELTSASSPRGHMYSSKSDSSSISDHTR
ncbi:unnamed protein product [Thelazia callipaeda]|uniref:Uncharacterized protein n=1 Tax=Thelazia callipaeda TaxID=103827 RepID=A0A0N5CL58_THECL|nr:unnamed protein product [Thelazia callipaeda]